MKRERRAYRQCQECRAVHQAAAFKRAGRPNVPSMDRQVRCPACGYAAPLWAFLPVEKPAEHERPEGTD